MAAGRLTRRLVALVVPVLAAASGSASASASDTVTLVTGDRVTLAPSGGVIVEPARGSRSPGFEVLRDGTHVRVVPDDVASLVPDVLDPELFDVTALVEMGYDDRHSDALPLIVRRVAGARTLASPLRAARQLSSIGATAAELDKDDAAELGDDLAAGPRKTALGGVTKVWLDRKVEADALDPYLSQVRAPAAWSAALTGAGVKVAVLDTGVDAAHPALAGQVDAQVNFSDAPSPADGNGHGTHVASLLAGTGAGSDGARQGIAPGVDLLSGKVLGDDRSGQESWVIAGMEWAAAQGADVVNLSLGGRAGETDDPLAQALDALTAQTGTLFVVAAGNSGGLGASPFTIETPGSAASALTVGAVSANDVVASFSSEGPTLGSYRLKPDVTAPGVGLLGARAGARDTGLYVGMSGTSQATPVVAGGAALLMQEHPAWTWQQIKAQIVGTADPHPLQTPWSQGGGRLDLDQATHQDLTADVATLGFGYVRYPDEAPKTRTVTLTNDGAEPVSVVISDQETSDAGVAAPPDALVASPASLTVPAHGTATTTVTLDPGLLADGLWQGGLTVSAGNTTRLQLPFGVYDEPERYDLALQLLDRNGEPYDPATGAEDPNGDATVPIFNGDNGFFYRLRPDENGRATARVAPGSYSVFARIVTPAGADRDTFTIAGTADLSVHSDTTYVIDARDAKRLDPPTVKGQETEPQLAVGITYSRHAGSRGYTELGFFDPQEVAAGRVYITPTEPVQSGTFETTFRWRLVPIGKIKPKSPDAYELLLNAPRFPDPLSPALDHRDVKDLAEVETTYRPIGTPGEYLAGTVYQTVETGVGLVYRAPQQAPGSTRTLMTAAPDVLWGHCLAVPDNDFQELCDRLHPYGRGAKADVQFAAALHPEVTETRHSASSLFVETGLGDGQHLSGIAPAATESSRLTLYENGELVATRDGAFASFPLPTPAGRFRLEQEWTLGDVFARSRRARTVWTFDSAPPSDPSQGGSTTPPFLTLDYGADVDGLGRAAPRRPLRLELRAGHVPKANAPERIDALALQWSVDDGASWHHASTKRTGTATFDATVPGRALRSGVSLSLRAVATDAAGDQVDQTVHGIIPVR